MPNQTKSMSKRNGKIEVYRFIFCICVLSFHIEKYILGEASLDNGIHFAYFPHGAMGVEFFFILSGFLMAKSISKSRALNPKNANSFSAKEGLNFIWRKYVSIFPQHLVAFVIAFVVYALVNDLSAKGVVLSAIDSIPNLFLIEMSGINFTNPNHIEWYISCMLIAMAIIYPICKKYYDKFTRYFAPLLALLILGYMIYTTSALTGVTKWTGVCYKSLLRAIVEISLGTCSYEFSRFLSSKKFTSSQRFIFTLIELVSLVASVLYVVLTMPRKYEVYVLALFFVLVSITFSGVSYGNKIFNNKFSYFLGKITLPIYLAQVAAIDFGNKYFADMSLKKCIVLIYILTIVIAFVVMVVGNFLMKIYNNKINLKSRA
jgi:peptidoglycan/LPS O-acetylase OafA/YrhL